MPTAGAARNARRPDCQEFTTAGAVVAGAVVLESAAWLGTCGRNIRYQKIGLTFREYPGHYDLSDEFFADAPAIRTAKVQLRDVHRWTSSLSIGRQRRPTRTIDLRFPDGDPARSGCGWGLTMKRAIEKRRRERHPRTPSKNQRFVHRTVDRVSTAIALPSGPVAWVEEFHQPATASASIEAFEHWAHERYNDFSRVAIENQSDDGGW